MQEDVACPNSESEMQFMPGHPAAGQSDMIEPQACAILAAIDKKVIESNLRMQEAGSLIGHLKKILGYDESGPEPVCELPTEPECKG
jgi:hypothetical protein